MFCKNVVTSIIESRLDAYFRALIYLGYRCMYEYNFYLAPVLLPTQILTGEAVALAIPAPVGVAAAVKAT